MGEKAWWAYSGVERLVKLAETKIPIFESKGIDIPFSADFLIALPLTEWQMLDKKEVATLSPLAWAQKNRAVLDEKLSDNDFKAFSKDGLGGAGFLQLSEDTYNRLKSPIKIEIRDKNNKLIKVIEKESPSQKMLKAYYGRNIPSYATLTGATGDHQKALEESVVFLTALVMEKYKFVKDLCKRRVREGKLSEKEANHITSDQETMRKLVFISYVGGKLITAIDEAGAHRDPLSVLKTDWVREKRGPAVVKAEKWIHGQQIARAQGDERRFALAR